MTRTSRDSARSMPGAEGLRCSSTEAPQENCPPAPCATTMRNERWFSCEASSCPSCAISPLVRMLPGGRSSTRCRSVPDSSSSARTRSSATARLLPWLARRGRQHFGHKICVEARALGNAPAQLGEVDLAVRLLPEVEGGEARRRLGGHVQRQPGAVGLAVREPVRELLLAQALQGLAGAVWEGVRDFSTP